MIRLQFVSKHCLYVWLFDNTVSQLMQLLQSSIPSSVLASLSSACIIQLISYMIDTILC